MQAAMSNHAFNHRLHRRDAHSLNDVIHWFVKTCFEVPSWGFCALASWCFETRHDDCGVDSIEKAHFKLMHWTQARTSLKRMLLYPLVSLLCICDLLNKPQADHWSGSFHECAAALFLSAEIEGLCLWCWGVVWMLECDTADCDRAVNTVSVHVRKGSQSSRLL